MSEMLYFGPALIYGLAGSFLLFVVLWIIQVIRRDAGVVDIGWTIGVGAMAVCIALVGEGLLSRRILLALMCGIWAFRLAVYILKDRILNGHEDSRYKRLRAHWGAAANRWFFFFFTAQSLLVVLFTLPFLPGAVKTAPLGMTDLLAVILWMIAMGGEWLADRQLARFRNKPENRGAVCRDGLWNWSRHPNYFFEWIHWFAYVLLAIGAPGFGLALIGPAAMYLFLMKVTGIPHVEREAVAKRGDRYREYQQTVNMLIPIPRKERFSHD